MNEGYVTYHDKQKFKSKDTNELGVNNDIIKQPKRNRFPIHGP